MVATIVSVGVATGSVSSGAAAAANQQQCIRGAPGIYYRGARPLQRICFAGPRKVSPNSAVTYTASVQNTGKKPITDLMLQVKPDLGTTLRSTSKPYTTVNGWATLTYAKVRPGGIERVRVTLVFDPLSQGDSYWDLSLQTRRKHHYPTSYLPVEFYPK
ncbi:MAG TPA: hypothetical protein VMU72_02755 [Gaiellaceae bacterium]|nr:hypothetical protein [Gaiellaceae bacterium]